MGRVVILGVFVADTAYRADRQPKMGETILGRAFALGPGGKGSNQAVAAASAGAETHMITRLGARPVRRHGAGDLEDRRRDPGGEIRRPGLYRRRLHLPRSTQPATTRSSSAPASRATFPPADIEERADLIAGASVFVTQLEQPIPAAHAGAGDRKGRGGDHDPEPRPRRRASARPARALRLRHPERIRGRGADRPARDHARRCAGRRQGAAAPRREAAVITLGGQGALFHDGAQTVHVPVFNAGPVKETTGAGDAFTGGFAAALARGLDPVAAVRFGSATAGISVTRAGTAPAMPSRAEIEALLARS